MAEGLPLSDERVRALAEEVLARAEYREFRRPPTQAQDLVARLADWLERNLGWLPDRIERNWDEIVKRLIALIESVFADAPLAVLIRFVLAAAAAGAIVILALAIVRALRRRQGDAPREAGAADPPSVRRLIAEADALAAAGRFLEAAHSTQLATLELLLRREWISLERSDPNRTLRRRVDTGRLPETERAEFLSLVDRLESRWFRDRGEDRDLYGAWREIHARLEALALAA